MTADLSDGRYHIPGRVASESERRWLSWSILVAAGRKGSHAGTSSGERAKRRKKGKAQRAARRVSR